MKSVKTVLLVLFVVILLGGIAYLAIQIYDPSLLSSFTTTNTRADETDELLPTETPTEAPVEEPTETPEQVVNEGLLSPTSSALAYNTVTEAPSPNEPLSGLNSGVIPTQIPSFTPIPSPSFAMSPSVSVSVTGSPTPVTSLPVTGPENMIPFLIVGAIILVGGAFLF